VPCTIGHVGCDVLTWGGPSGSGGGCVCVLEWRVGAGWRTAERRTRAT